MYATRIGAVDVDFCSRCQGLWLDAGELPALVPGAGGRLAAAAATHATPYPCPRCGAALAERTAGDVTVDACEGCGGVFLDDGELQRLRLGGPGAPALTPARPETLQRRARRAEALSAVYGTAAPVAKEPLAERAAFVRDVYLWLVATLLLTAVGAWIGVQDGRALRWFWPAVVVEIVLFLLTLWLRRTQPWNYVLLVAYTFVSGFTLGAVVDRYVGAGKGAIVGEAAGLTAVIFLALSIYVHVTRRDFEWLGGILFVALIAILVSGLWMLLFGARAFTLFLWSVVSAVVFSGYILYDTSNILLKYETDEVVSAVIDLYLDVVNLFLDLLRILSYLQRND